MKPVDHINPIVPGNWVRRVEEKRRKRDPGKGQQQKRYSRRTITALSNCVSLPIGNRPCLGWPKIYEFQPG